MDTTIMTSNHSQYMYNKPFGFDSTDLNFDDVSNKLFCTFTRPDDLENIVSTINRRHAILYNKIFILESPQSEELMCTYNIDAGNSSDAPLPNTILLHRKKESNTLYTINSLNEVVRAENNGILDRNFIIDWDIYKNSIIVTNTDGIKRISTRIFEVIDKSLKKEIA